MPRILSQKYLSIPVPAATLEQIREAAWQRREPMYYGYPVFTIKRLTRKKD